MPPSASEHMEPRLVEGASTPTPRKDMKDSVKMADGICRQVVATIWPMQLGSRCRLMIRPLEASQGTGRGHVFLFLEGEDLAADDAAHTHPIQAGKGNEHAHQVGAHLLKELRQEEALVVGDELGDMGPMAVAISRMISTSGRGVDNVHDALHDHIHRTAEEAGDGAVERTPMTSTISAAVRPMIMDTRVANMVRTMISRP